MTTMLVALFALVLALYAGVAVAPVRDSRDDDRPPRHEG
jgi:hypothetical protein